MVFGPGQVPSFFVDYCYATDWGVACYSAAMFLVCIPGNWHDRVGWIMIYEICV